jgi:uncharacterized protein YcaQ
VPNWVDTKKVDDKESLRYFLGRSLQALGVGTPRDIAHYSYRSHTRPTIHALTQEGVFIPIKGDIGGAEVDLLIHRDNLPLVDQALDGVILAERQTFLNQLDSLVLAKDTVTSWNLKPGWKPARQNSGRWDTIHILHKDRLVGRLCPKLERMTAD